MIKRTYIEANCSICKKDKEVMVLGEPEMLIDKCFKLCRQCLNKKLKGRDLEEFLIEAEKRGYNILPFDFKK